MLHRDTLTFAAHFHFHLLVCFYRGYLISILSLATVKAASEYLLMFN